MSDKALSGVRVLDFTHYLAGPLGTFQLAMQGAEVIKVEPRGGEGMRHYSATSKAWAERAMSPHWLVVNAGKRSMTLDISKPEGVEIIKRLVRDVDVVTENFRPGVMERLGIGYAQLSEVNPQLIYCAISGFGSTGPERATPSFDGKIQAMSGLMSLTGDPGAGPMRAGFAAGDVVAGLTSAFAISTALYQRTQTGRGQFVDVAMLDSLVNMFAGLMADYTVAGVRHGQFGNRSVGQMPTADRFRCGDGFIVLAVLTEKQYTALMIALDRADSLDDPRFVDWFSRLEHAAELRELIEGAMAEGTPMSWERKLTAAHVPCATIYSLPEISEHPQVKHRGLIQEVETPFGAVRLVGPGFQLAYGSGSVPGPAAMVGEHTEAILAMAGYDEQQIHALREAEIV